MNPAAESAVSSEPLLLPLYLKMSGLKVLIVGAGPVATSKLATFVPTGARVVVVAPDISAGMQEAGAGVVEIHQRPFEESDLDDAWFVVTAATADVNRTVAELGARRRLFVNAVDDPPNATAYLGGLVRRGGLTISISTAGRAPALAGLLREGIDRLLPEDLEAWFESADALRRHWKATGVPMEARRLELAEALLGEYCGRLPSCARRVAPDADE